MELDGTWENSKHGLQLSVSMCKEVVPRDQAGILAYLSSGIIKGIGPETAKAIVARFGDKTMEVLEKEPDKLLSVKGIAQKKLKAIIKSYGETKALSDLMIYLAPFGVSMKKVAMIREEFGDNSLRIVKTDPFQLCKIKGFGFMTVDSVARKTKVSLKHPLRYSGAINYVLDEARVSGHLFLSVDETVGQCYELLNMGCDNEVVSEEEIRQAISNERVESRIYVEGSRVYLSYERMCEVKSAKRIVSMILQEGFTKIDDLDSKIDNAERTLHQKLAPSQRNAVKLCLSHPISIMTGGPGSGKTTTLRFILDIYKAAFPANEVLLAAPTGRASRRMAEQTGMHASTLHSALGLVTDEDSPLNDKELLSADLVVVDEFSMVDMRLAYILLDRIKSGAQLIIVGDADQLPSVGAGNVLREMIRSEKVPTQFCMNGEALASIIADAPIKMPPDEDVGHPGSVVASFTAQPTADPPVFSQTATAPKSTQPAQQQVQPPVQQSHAPAPEPPKTLDEYLRVMTIEQAKAVKVDFGRFSGWSLGEIAMKSPGDLAWYVKNYSGHNLALKAGATKLLETVGQMAS